MSVLFKNRKVQWFVVMLLAAGTVLLFDNLLPSEINWIVPVATKVELSAPAPYNQPTDSVKPLEKQAPTALSYRIAEYHMNVAYTPETKQLKGQQTLTWENPGSVPVKEIYLHLYPNAFA